MKKIIQIFVIENSLFGLSSEGHVYNATQAKDGTRGWTMNIENKEVVLAVKEEKEA